MASPSRTLSGSLDELPLPDLLQVLANGAKTGRLSLSWRDGYGMVILRHGRIVYAASNAAREALGSILLCRGLIEETALREALTVQHRHGETRRLGALLLAGGAIAAADLERVLREQTETVLSGLFRWPGGFFKFDPEPDAAGPSGEIEAQVDVRDFLLRVGLSAEGVLLEAARQLDEANRREAAGPAPSAELSGLKVAVSGLRSPMVTGEMTQRILSYAASVVPRAVLFAARRDFIQGIGQRGVRFDGRSAEERVRGLRLGWDRPSIVSLAARGRESLRGALDPVEGNADLVLGLGGDLPTEAIAVPMVVGDATALVLYGDNAGSSLPIGPTEGLELLLLQAGLAVERDVLQERLRALAEHQSAAAEPG